MEPKRGERTWCDVTLSSIIYLFVSLSQFCSKDTPSSSSFTLFILIASHFLIRFLHLPICFWRHKPMDSLVPPHPIGVGYSMTFREPAVTVGGNIIFWAIMTRIILHE
jgi:hypothetical protein